MYLLLIKIGNAIAASTQHPRAVEQQAGISRRSSFAGIIGIPALLLAGCSDETQKAVTHAALDTAVEIFIDPPSKQDLHQKRYKRHAEEILQDLTDNAAKYNISPTDKGNLELFFRNYQEHGLVSDHELFIAFTKVEKMMQQDPRNTKQVPVIKDLRLCMGLSTRLIDLYRNYSSDEDLQDFLQTMMLGACSKESAYLKEYAQDKQHFIDSSQKIHDFAYRLSPRVGFEGERQKYELAKETLITQLDQECTGCMELIQTLRNRGYDKTRLDGITETLNSAKYKTHNEDDILYLRALAATATSNLQFVGEGNKVNEKTIKTFVLTQLIVHDGDTNWLDFACKALQKGKTGDPEAIARAIYSELYE